MSALRRTTVRGVLPPPPPPCRPSECAGRQPLLLAPRTSPCEALMTLAAGLPGSERSCFGENGWPCATGVV